MTTRHHRGSFYVGLPLILFANTYTCIFCLSKRVWWCVPYDIFKQGDLMVVANAGDSRVVLGTASDNGVVTTSSSSST
jgi:serine/threonine protein phosphatase PrpC